MLECIPERKYLKDYSKPSHVIKSLDLCFELDDRRTIVTSKMELIQNLDLTEKNDTLVLNGENIELLWVEVNGEKLSEEQYQVDEKTLTIPRLPESFTLRIQNTNDPVGNTQLDGLYKSGSIFCSQNEPQGFRRITYFLDRPDVMTKYRTKIIASKEYPVLLSNGNPIGHGDLEDGRHWVEWEDPFLKPSYLFAIVAGDLGSIRDRFTTRSGREIDLRIYCDKGNEERCWHAMDSLKKSMKWDEEVFGLEYDLDIFMIVAVDSFNMGAMENKGLNIFNTSCILADPKTATDMNYARVETVVAHEYFHNWTGNRVTCRDWFQLTLKEGLTVFRDQEFSSDMHSRPVKRIEDVLSLRGRQFPEDAGPNSHPIQPDSYIQINNFYTATVYEKGAEIIRMIQTLLGAKNFRKGIDKYFELYDGQAVTTEDFVYAMEAASGIDLSHFRSWYHQSGTPEVHVHPSYDTDSKKYTLKIMQNTPITADQEEKEPLHIPLCMGFLDEKGKELRMKHPDLHKNDYGYLLSLKKAEESFVFEGLSAEPTLSLNRHFLAPIKVHMPYSKADRMFLMANDSDPFNRWESGQRLATELMMDLLDMRQSGQTLMVHPGYLEAYEALLTDEKLDKALKAVALHLPSEGELMQQRPFIDVEGIHHVREFLSKELARHFQRDFESIYSAERNEGTYEFDAKHMAQRSLKNTCLSYLVRTEQPAYRELAYQQYQSADNMTDQYAALVCLSHLTSSETDQALEDFYHRWHQDKLVLCKWLSVQAMSRAPGVLERITKLMQDPAYDEKIPNLVRALLGSFIQNHAQFHVNTGSGYVFMADQIIHLDAVNPQVAARLTAGFEKYAKLDTIRQQAMERELQRIVNTQGLSTNVFEIASNCLKSRG